MTRALVLAFVLVPALAAADDGAAPVASHAVTVGVIGHVTKLGGLNESGWGPNVELALGGGRWHYFAEGSVSWIGAGPEGAVVDGTQLRGGLGVRWLARSFEIGRADLNGTGGSFDLLFEAFGGVQRFSWDADVAGPLVRPDIGAGIAWQLRVRAFHRQLAFRSSARVAFAPADRESVSAVCRGTCTMPARSSNSGVVVVFGAQW
jgi:hypothetical protein